MEYIEFFLFCLFAFGFPISIVLLKYRRDKKNIKEQSLVESGIAHRHRPTNRHSNTFYPIALTMVFTYIPILVLIPLVVVRKTGQSYDEQLYMGMFVIAITFLGYVIFRFSGGFNDPR